MAASVPERTPPNHAMSIISSFPETAEDCDGLPQEQGEVGGARELRPLAGGEGAGAVEHQQVEAAFERVGDRFIEAAMRELRWRPSIWSGRARAMGMGCQRSPTR